MVDNDGKEVFFPLLARSLYRLGCGLISLSRILLMDSVS